MTAKKMQRNFPTRGAFQISMFIIIMSLFLLKVLLFHAASVFLRTSCMCSSAVIRSLCTPPVGASPMAMKSKHEYLFSLLTEEQKEALGRVQDALEEDPLYLEPHEKEEEENA